jgi:hypothetical protein
MPMAATKTVGKYTNKLYKGTLSFNSQEVK